MLCACLVHWLPSCSIGQGEGARWEVGKEPPTSCTWITPCSLIALLLRLPPCHLDHTFHAIAWISPPPTPQSSLPLLGSSSCHPDQSKSGSRVMGGGFPHPCMLPVSLKSVLPPHSDPGHMLPPGPVAADLLANPTPPSTALQLPVVGVAMGGAGQQRTAGQP